MIRKVSCVAVIGFILGPLAVFAQNASKEKAAVAAAEKWLNLVDKGEYAESWREASTYFRNRVTQQEWEQASRSVRKPLGKLITRKLANETYRGSLPGAPDAQYVVMQFETSFANKKSAVETVTAMMDKDGKWRIAGYFIR